MRTDEDMKRTIRRRSRQIRRRFYAGTCATAAVGVLAVGIVTSQLSVDQQALEVAAGPADDLVATTAPPMSISLHERRVTPPKSEQPQLPSTEELETQAAAVPMASRQLAGLDSDGKVLGWWDGRSSANVRPIFSTDEVDSTLPAGTRLIGIYISGLGVVPRSEYEDPAFDSEEAAREKWGPDYEGRRQ